ncbi:MAG: InlB B-repeat-containing protein [Dysgonamonadaceae bacterium]|jgi:uncharacterized repeat protein (TIGR02543 family)|nr:InlB B-repeat-containing protein [Dysgonamonadaceae bacterium]
MKKITLLLMMCCMSILAFAAGGNITYVLNGGVTNDYGWTSKADMLVGLNQDYNVQYSIAETATWYTWETLDVILAASDPVTRIAVFTGAPAGPNKMWELLTTAKWTWLHDYIVATVASQGVAVIEESETAHAYWRYNVSAFFVSGQRTSWPASANYVVAGTPGAFMPAWKHGFAGPATYDGSVEVLIPDPYKEGESFLGWYRNADFSGAKLTSIPAGTEGDITLYAKFGEYIPTCAEVWALTGATKAQGVVSYVNGTTAYIQDASAGLEITFATVASMAAGDKITVSGTTAADGKLTGAEVTAKETASLPTAQTLLLSAVLADAGNQYTNELVYIEGLKITAVDASTATLTDETNTIVLNAAGISQAVGKKVNVKAVALFDGTTHTLVGPASFVTLAAVAAQDPYAYPAYTTGDKTYTLTNKWLISVTMDNFSANPIASAAQMVRGMVAQNGKMYFPDRGLHQLTVLDGATGERLPAIVLDDNVYFKYTNSGGDLSDAGTLRYNDIKQDAAGNILLGNCITSNAQPFQVWKVNLEDGTGTLIVNEILLDNPDFAASIIRFDAFGVYGDVNTHAIIMAANASAMEAYKWEIINGVASPAEVILIDTSVEGTFLTGLNSPGTAPQIFPLDENYFYLDGNATLPTLIDMEGNVVDGFFNVPPDVEVWSAGNNAGHNGLIEFELGGEHFFLIASMNTSGTPPSTFRLFKWKDANKEFKDIESLWTLPANGMGALSNAYRTAMPSVEVNEAAKTATLYLYTGENGYGVYELKDGATDGIQLPIADKPGIYVSGKTIRLTEGVAAVQVYDIAGRLIAKKAHTAATEVAAPGIYVVKAVRLTGETVVSKVIVK